MNNKTTLQIIFWGLIIGILFGMASFVMPIRLALTSTFSNVICLALTFYLNTVVLFPKFYKTTNSGTYFLACCILVILGTVLMVELDIQFVASKGNFAKHVKNLRLVIASRNVFWQILMVMTGTVYLIQRQLREQSVLSKEIQEEKLQTELKLLKSQINPHFLFNALNNIYSLSYMKSEVAPESILKLSNMLRYVIEDCVTEFVPLQLEVEYMNNYIMFQKMKSPDVQSVVFNVKLEGDPVKVAPLLYIPFIENSFKYSKIEDFENAFITIDISTDEVGKVFFSIVNSVPPIGKARSGAGTGIKNVKHRLEILYPNRHILTIRDEENKFTVKLEIETHENTMHNN